MADPSVLVLVAVGLLFAVVAAVIAGGASARLLLRATRHEEEAGVAPRGRSDSM